MNAQLHPNDSESFSGGLGAPSDPAPFAGGQGRSAEDVEHDGRIGAAVCMVLLIAMCAAAWMRGFGPLCDWIVTP